MKRAAPISDSQFPSQLSSTGSSGGGGGEDNDDDMYGEDSFESAPSPPNRKQETKGGGAAAANSSSVNLADYVPEPSKGAPGADVIATITRGLDGVSPHHLNGSLDRGYVGGSDDKSKNFNGEYVNTKVTYADVLDEDDNALLKRFNIVLSPRSAMGPQEYGASTGGSQNDRSNYGNDRISSRTARSNGTVEGSMAPGSPISTTRSKRPMSQEMSPSVAATIASVREADMIYKSKKPSKVTTAVAGGEDTRGRRSKDKDRGDHPPPEPRGQGSGHGKSAGSNHTNREDNFDDNDTDNSGSDGNSDIDDAVKKMARRKKTERGYGEDAEYKVLHLKRKVDSYREKLRHETDVKDRLTGVCNALKDDLIIARQRIQELEDELASVVERVAQRRAKASSKAALAKKASRAVAEENEALRSIILEMQEADRAAREQIEALAAVNAELNIQYKQSASREIEWRTAHQELSDRVLRQFSQRILKDVISMSQLRAAASGDYPAIPAPPSLAASASAPSTLRVKGAEDTGSARPDFRLDNVRMEKETLSKPAKQRGFPPI